jgi:hypothetical protein
MREIVILGPGRKHKIINGINYYACPDIVMFLIHISYVTAGRRL